MSDFPKIKITGGPHAKDTKLVVNGEEVPKVRRVELVADVNDAIRVTTYQIAMVADVEVEGVMAEGTEVTARISLRLPKEASELSPQATLFDGRGATLREAVEAALVEAENYLT